MNDFMKDRYGVDELTCVLGGAGMLLALIGTIANLDPLTWIALAIVLLALARAFSKNITVRCNENNAFRSFSKRVPVLGNLVAHLGSITPAGRNASGGPTASAVPNIEYEREAHRPEDVEGAQDLALPQMPQLRADLVRAQGQGQAPRDLPALPGQDGDEVLASQAATALRHRHSHGRATGRRPHPGRTDG